MCKADRLCPPECTAFIIRENVGGVNCGRTDKTVKNRDLSAGADGAVSGDGSVLLTPRAAASQYTVEALTPSEETEENRVNINTASASELDALPGIGPVLAQRIIDRRTEQGPFTSVEELLEVDGIGQATLDGLREFITVKETKE